MALLLELRHEPSQCARSRNVAARERFREIAPSPPARASPEPVAAPWEVRMNRIHSALWGAPSTVSNSRANGVRALRHVVERDPKVIDGVVVSIAALLTIVVFA